MQVERTTDVNLHGFKITAAESDATKGQLPQAKLPIVAKSVPPLIFLHGLLGQGRMWR
jgi:pimeloyl-ACP methyl ester carboxylesterase